MDKREERYCFLDVLRAAAVCAVVLLHTITGVMDTTDMTPYPSQKTAFLAGLDLITWCVPVFVIISGFLFLRPDRETGFRLMTVKYCRRILLALFLFGVPYALLELIVRQGRFAPEMAWQAFLMVLQGKSWSHMWYLYLIFFLYLFTPLFKAILRVMPRWALYAVMGVLALGSSVLPFAVKAAAAAGFDLSAVPVLPDGGIYVFYYLCGYLAAAGGRAGADEEAGGKPRMAGTAGLWIMSAAVLLLCGVMVCSRLAGGYTVQMAYNYPPTVLLSILLFCLARRLEPVWRKRGGKALSRFGALSFTIYLIHPVCLNVFYKFLHLTPLSFPLPLSLPFFFCVTMLFSICGAVILRKLPPLRRYVL